MSIREDQNRFKNIIKGCVRDDFKRFVTNGELIGKQENDLIKIPLPRIDIPTFRFGSKEKEKGVGQGDGEEGQSADGQAAQGCRIGVRPRYRPKVCPSASARPKHWRWKTGRSQEARQRTAGPREMAALGAARRTSPAAASAGSRWWPVGAESGSPSAPSAR